MRGAAQKVGIFMSRESKHDLARRHRSGLTLIECTLAMAILSVAFVAVVSTAAVGHEHLNAAGKEFNAQRLGRDLM